MKRMIILLLCCMMLAACGKEQTGVPVNPEQTTVPAETERAAESFLLYYGDDQAMNLLSREVFVPEINAETVLQQLTAAGILPEDVSINSFATKNGQIAIDFTDGFRVHLNAMGTAGERMLMGSVVNTFLNAFDARTLSVTVEGNLLESGHMVYDLPMGFLE